MPFRVGATRIAIVGLLSLGSAAGHAQAQGTAGGQVPQGPQQASPGVGLSPEEQAKAQQIYQDEGQKIFSLRQQLMAKQSELNAVLASPTPDERRIQALTKDVSVLNDQLVRAEVSMQRRLYQAGVPAWSQGMCPMCGSMGSGMGMGRGMMGGQWDGRGMMGGQWDHCW